MLQLIEDKKPVTKKGGLKCDVCFNSEETKSSRKGGGTWQSELL